jgi:hypothetical protein
MQARSSEDRRQDSSVDAVVRLSSLGARLGPAMRIGRVQVPSIARSGSGKLRIVVNEVSLHS